LIVQALKPELKTVAIMNGETMTVALPPNVFNFSVLLEDPTETEAVSFRTLKAELFL